MNTLHAVSFGEDGSYPKTLCGVKLGKGVIRCGVAFFERCSGTTQHEPCGACAAALVQEDST